MMPQNRSEMYDDLNSAAAGLARDRGGDGAIETAKIVDFDPVNMNARVQVLRAGIGSVHARVSVKYQGPKSGTGEAYSFYPGQLVRVYVPNGVAYGTQVIPEIVGTVYTEKDHRAPAYAPWHQDGTGTVQVFGRKGAAYGNAVHVNQNSDVARTDVGQVDHESWANEHQVVNGTNMSVAEQITRDGANYLQQLARRYS